MIIIRSVVSYNMSQKIRWILFIVGLALIYGLAYFIFINTNASAPIFGVIPIITLYIIPIYFISSFLIEFTVGTSNPRNLIAAFKKAFILLAFFLILSGIYLLFYKYILIANHIENTFIGKNAYFIFIGVMVFLGMKFGNKVYAKNNLS